MYSHIRSLEQFRELSSDDQKACNAERWSEVENQMRATVQEVFDRHEWQKRLVPQLPTRPSTPAFVDMNPQIPTDIDDRVRMFFRDNPDTVEIRVGSNIYTRARR